MNKRYPIGPLWEFVFGETYEGRDTQVARDKFSPGSQNHLLLPSYTNLARICGVTESLPQKWKQRGGLPERAADRVACNLGVHPFTIWDDWYDDDPLLNGQVVTHVGELA